MSARGRKSVNPLDKKIPVNPKFKHVRSTLDTGASLSKYLEKLEEMKRDYNFKKDEIFKRMKIPTFAQLVVQVADFDTADETGTIAEEGEPYIDSCR
ncbi:centrosomal protein of 41 kDa, partial [Elysia marginata]